MLDRPLSLTQCCVSLKLRPMISMARTALACTASVKSSRNALALLLGVFVGPAPFHSIACAAAEFPNRPIQLIVPYAAGGVTDQVARLLSQGLERHLGQPVLVVNRPGASTIIGTQSVARSAPDGHTIILVSLPHVSNVTLFKELPYAQSDFTPITPVANSVNVLVVNAALPINSLAELIAYIKARPGEINYATFGIGSSAHLAALLLESKIGEKLTPVHYRGGAPAMIAVMTGEVQMAFGGPLSIAGGVGAGRLRPIAVTSERRLTAFPNVPTLRESGVDYVKGTWFGLLAPAGTPEPIIRQLYEAARHTMEQPDVRKAVLDSGAEVFVTSPEEFARFIAEETKLWSRVLAGVSVDKQ
jgi:tripartite-type tricarboxylate transporter receptor subunit TctC